VSAPAEKETARVEAFSDGVFAIAVTLLVLEIRVPHVEASRLPDALLALWPSYFALVTSFFTISVMWLNHHRMFSYLGRTDARLLLLNGLLLLGITFVPFPTAVVAAYLGQPGQRAAACFLAIVYVGIAIAFNLLWRYASSEAREPGLLHAHANLEEVRAIRAAYRWGPLYYLGTLALSLVDGRLGVASNLALAVYWALPPRRGNGGGAGVSAGR
jgi:uncharacterized membrane protein